MQIDESSNNTSYPLEGHKEIISQFTTAFYESRLHHAWLLAGPVGIGKAKLAQSLAAWLLSRPTGNGQMLIGSESVFHTPLDFSLSPENRDVRLVMSGTHPDLLTLSAIKEDKNKSGQIKVEQVRKIPAFLSHSAARDGWRIAIIDSLDDINRDGANALLKILEEPPEKTILFVLISRLGQILPTIRSRCIVQLLLPLSFEECLRVIASHFPKADDEKLSLLVHLSDGSPGQAIALAETGALDLLKATCSLLSDPEALDADILAISEKWAPLGQKAGPMRKSAMFLFDKIIAAAALEAAAPHQHHLQAQLFTSIPFIRHFIDLLARRHSAHYLSSLHKEFVSEFEKTERLYLDMGVVISRLFHKINSRSGV